MVPPPQPTKKRMINNKKPVLSIKFPLMNGDRDRRNEPLWRDELRGPENVKFRFACFWEFFSAHNSNRWVYLKKEIR